MNRTASTVFKSLASSLLLAVCLCWSAPVPAAETRAFVSATDFSTGTLAGIQFGPPRLISPNVASISSDPVLRWSGGLLYVVNRFGYDNVQVLDPSNNYALVKQFSVGNGSNPHDIAVVSPTKAYVTRYETSDLWIVNPQTGLHTGTISLATFADADGIPEMDHMALRGGRLFVSIEALDRNNFFSPSGLSKIAVIDVATNTVIDVNPGLPGVQAITLPLQNPTTEMVVDPTGEIVVGCTGSYGVLDGGVLLIDPVAMAVATTEITEAALGGDIADVAVLNAVRGFAIISDASFNTLLKAYRRDLGTTQGTLVSSSGFFLADMEVNDRTELWVCDRNFSNPGVRVFNAITHAELTSIPLSTGLPPQDLAFDGSSTVDVPSGMPVAQRPGLTITGISPNPSRGAVEIAFALPEVAITDGSGSVNAEIIDLAGRPVWGTTVPVAGRGSYSLQWDGRDRSGRVTSAGVYFLRVRGAGGSAAARLVRIN